MNKRLILLILIGFSILNKGFSQDDDRKLKYGIQVGLIRSNLYQKVIGEVDPMVINLVDFSPHYGYRINGFLSKRVGSKFGFSVEPGYKRMGVRYFQGNFKLISRNINLPVTASYYIINNLAFSIGVEGDINMGTVYFTPEKEDRTSNEGARLSGLIGLSYTLNKRLSVGLRYLHAFNHDFDIKFTDNFGDPTGNEVRHSYRSLGVLLNVGFN